MQTLNYASSECNAHLLTHKTTHKGRFPSGISSIWQKLKKKSECFNVAYKGKLLLSAKKYLIDIVTLGIISREKVCAWEEENNNWEAIDPKICLYQFRYLNIIKPNYNQRLTHLNNII